MRFRSARWVGIGDSHTGNRAVLSAKARTYSLLLISPRHAYRNFWTLKEVAELLHKEVTAYPLALPTLAAMTPDHYDITLVDEEFEEVPLRSRPDLVGISAMTTNITRAYELADSFRSAGVPVVMGGAHTSMVYEESLEHSDSVVVGEAEGLWEQLLEDFEAGKMESVYKSDKPADVNRTPPPRWDLVDTDKLLCCNVQISRGCPNACEYCCVTETFGSKQRYRDIDNVIDEISALPTKQISFVDDNFASRKKYARELLERLKPLGVSWNCLAGLSVADDVELLQEMADAGCNSIVIGFETLDPSNISEVRKNKSRFQKYKQAVDRIHGVGIHVIAAFIVGFDADTLETYDHIYEFAVENNISYVMLNILTVFPGTGLYERMKEEGRLVDVSPECLNGMFPSMKYKNMSRVEIFNKYYQTLERIWSFEDLRKKGLAVFGDGSFRNREVVVGLKDKIQGSLTILKHYFLTFDRNASRRRMFLDLVKLAKKDVVDVSIIVEYLLFVAAANVYVEKHRNIKAELFKKMAEQEDFYESEL